MVSALVSESSSPGSSPSRGHCVVFLDKTLYSRGGDSHMERTGMLVGNFEFNP